jgi:hypothetical protein
MSSYSSSLGSRDVPARERNGNQKEEDNGEDSPVESIYRGVFEEVHGESDPAIDPWRQSRTDTTLESYLRGLGQSRTSSPDRNKHSAPTATRSLNLVDEFPEEIDSSLHFDRPRNANGGFPNSMYPNDSLQAA